MISADMATAAVTRGAALGLAAAALFGASAPLSKHLLPGTSPLVLSGLLYLGAGLALSLYAGLRRLRAPDHGPGGRGTVEAPVARRDVLTLAVIILVGGILSPLAMLTGLG